MLLELNEQNYSRKLEDVSKKIAINGYQFLSASVGSSFHSYVNNLFYTSRGFNVEEYTEQQSIFTSPIDENFNLIFTGSSIQIGEGIIPTTYQITYDNTYILTDDGKGNIFHNDKLLGNIFYEHGVAILDDTETFSGSVVPLSDVYTNNNLVEVNFTKRNSIIKTRINFYYDNGKYNLGSSNTTFDKTVHIPYITKIVLYNTKNEVVMVAKLSKPISTVNDLYFILEHIIV